MDSDPWADSASPAATASPLADGSRAVTAISPPQGVYEPAAAGSSSQPQAGPSNGSPSSQKDDLAGTGATEDDNDDAFDDFDDFDAAPPAGAETGIVLNGEEGDGDGFGDFEEGDFGDEMTAALSTTAQTVVTPGLRLRPLPPRPELQDQLSTLLSPLLTPDSPLFTSEPPRIASSSRQILPTESARDAYIQLASAPQLKALDWTRSRVRREHLIHLGIPVDLDEVDSHRLAALPPLNIATSFADLRSAPGTGRRSESAERQRRRSGDVKGKGRATEANGTAAVAGPAVSEHGSGRQDKYGLGVRPEMDTHKAEELCGVEEDQISLLPPSALKRVQEELVQSSSQASAVLAHLLQLKDSLSHESTVYNGMIGELISNAAKAAKSAQQAGSGGVFKRQSIRRPASVSAAPAGTARSGTATPKPGSPAIR